MGNKESRLRLSKGTVNSIEDFKKLTFIEDTNNGLWLGNHYLPEEILIYILSYVEAKQLLDLSLVCKKWYSIVRSRRVWMIKYERAYNKEPRKLPWFVYYSLFASELFETNLLKNGNGAYRYEHWSLGRRNTYLHFEVEPIPVAADPLPLDVPEFNGATSCFAVSCYYTYNQPLQSYDCSKTQIVQLCKSNLSRFILDYYKPHIYISEWVTGRIDCSCAYTLRIHLFNNNWNEGLGNYNVCHTFEKGQGGKWVKKEILIDNYPENVRQLEFYHKGYDITRRGGHFGTKMTGGVVRVLFDSIQPKPGDKFLE